MGRMWWLRRAATGLALALAVAQPQLALAGGDDATAATGATGSVTVTVEEAGQAGGESTDPQALFAVRYYLQRLVDTLRLLVTLDAAGDASLLAEFAEARADALAGMDPQSEWYDRVAADIATYLRLAQDRVVEAQVEGKPADEAIAALQEVIQRLEELAAKLDEAAAGAGGTSGGGIDDGTQARAGDGAAGEETDSAVDPEDEPGEPGEDEPAGLDEAVEAAEEAEIVVGAVAMIDPAVVRELREQGYGYGQIALLYAAAQRISEKTGQQVTVEQVADLLAQAGGEDGGRHGFGKNLRAVLAQFGIERRELKPGRLVAAAHRDDEDDDDEDELGEGDDAVTGEDGDEDTDEPASGDDGDEGDADQDDSSANGRDKAEVKSRSKVKAKADVKERKPVLQSRRDDEGDDDRDDGAAEDRDDGDDDDGDDDDRRNRHHDDDRGDDDHDDDDRDD